MTKYSFIGNLIRVGGDAKTVKGNKGGVYITGIMYLIPFKHVIDGKRVNLCPMAEQAGCAAPCLVTAGRGRMSNVHAGRLRKTEWFVRDRAAFMAQLVKDCDGLVRYCAKRNVKPALRLNGTSDIRWETIPCERDGVAYPHIFAAFPEIQFYDYTKIANRKTDGIANYSLTFSYSEANPAYQRQVRFALDRGLNVAVVFRDADSIPTRFLGRRVINGDETDMRFLDPSGVVVGLYAKGQAKKDASGFVVDAAWA